MRPYTPSRRQTIGSIVTLVAATAGGVVLTSDPARASVAVQDLSIPDREYSAPDDSVTLTITGDVTAAAAYAPSDFTAPTDGESIQVPIRVTLMGQVRDSSGQTQLKATDSVEVVVTVTNEAATVSTSVTVGGSGQVLFQNNESDAPPA